MSPPRPTIRDVAAAAGVSLGTVSRALNKSGRVSSAAAIAVAQAAARLGYEPDSVAQSMRGRASGVVGVTVSDFANPFFAQVIKSAEARLQRSGYALLVANTDNDRAREKSLIELFRRRRVDGLLLGPCECEDAKLIDSVERDYFPVVALDRDLSATGSGLHVDHFQGAAQATRYLLNLGHTRIALLSSGNLMRPGRERIKGFTAAFAERELAPDPKLIVSERSSMEFVFSEALALLSANDPPTAFICLGTRILAGVLQALRHVGRRMPQDASVVSVGDTDLARLFSPAITAVTWDFQAVGEALAELLLSRIGPQGAPEGKRIVMTPRLIARESCAPAPASTRSRIGAVVE